MPPLKGPIILPDLSHLLRPKTIAVVGGGAWCANVVRECGKIGYEGKVWPVHPTRDEIGGAPTFKSVEALPEAPDACFIGVNRHATVEVLRALSLRGAGGAVAFASGFREAEAELADGGALEEALLEAAGEMPVLGPNCYGLLNLLDGAALWPDQHGAIRVDSGVAIVTQSSNIAINLTMQTRGLPMAYVVTAGNQAQMGLAGIGAALLQDPRVTALGLYIEGVGDLRQIEALAAEARALGKSIVALKVGASDQAQASAISHTASIAGSDAGADALFARLGIARVASLGAFLETLKLLHVAGPLVSNRIASMSCSGGEASLVADSSLGRALDFPPLAKAQRTALADALGPKVALANPLDYHTYIWGDAEALGACFTAMMQADLALGMVVLDFPRRDRCDASDWVDVIGAVAGARDASGVPMAIVASLPDTMPEDLAAEMVRQGLVPLSGLDDALAAIEAAAWLGQARDPALPILQAPPLGPGRMLDEAAAKSDLADFGLRVPASREVATAKDAADAASEIGFPVVLKGTGMAHKSEAGMVALGLTSEGAVLDAAHGMATSGYLIEEIVGDAVAELLIGVVADPAHGFVLTLGAGGVLTEVMRDSTSLLLPVSEADIMAALDRLRIAPLIHGYRGRPAAHIPSIAVAVLAVQNYVIAHQGEVLEVEVNPLIATPDDAFAADALIRLKET